jgi:hypothetical protein
MATRVIRHPEAPSRSDGLEGRRAPGRATACFRAGLRSAKPRQEIDVERVRAIARDVCSASLRDRHALIAMASIPLGSSMVIDYIQQYDGAGVADRGGVVRSSRSRLRWQAVDGA